MSNVINLKPSLWTRLKRWFKSQRQDAHNYYLMYVGDMPESKNKAVKRKIQVVPHTPLE